MEKVTNIPNQRAIEAEACAWIAQLDGEEPSSEDLTAFREWVHRSPQHEAEIRRLSALWKDMNILTELAVPREAPKPAWYSSFWVRGALATAVVLVAVLVFVSTEPVGTQQAPLLYTTTVGEQKTIGLGDGSTIQLNTNSQLKVDYSANGREIRLLQGEAYFEVARDPHRPFVVYAGAGIVRALGTAFTVHLKDQNIEVVVTEGSVELSSIASVRDNTIMNAKPELAKPDSATAQPAKPPTNRLAALRAGQQARFSRELETIQPIELPEISRKLSWRQGMLVFSGEPLEQVVAEVSRYTPVKIIITDPEIRQIRIGGYFKVGETGAMFDALETSFGIDVAHINPTLIHLSAPSK